MKKNILVLVDMEGVIGIYNSLNYEYCREKMCKEVSILFDVLSKNKNYSIFFCNCHDDGKMTDILIPKFSHIHFITQFWNIDFNIKYEYAIFSGFHAKNGKGILSHTFRPEIKKMFLGNKEVGEIEIFINWLSYYDIPIIFISADDMAVCELEGIDCVVSTSKYMEDILIDDIYLENLYKKYKSNLNKALQRKVNIKNFTYLKYPVYVQFNDEKLLLFLEEYNYDTENSMIKFCNTVSLMENLLILANLINEYNLIEYKEMLNKIKNRFQNCDQSKIKNNDLNQLLNLSISKLTINSLKDIYIKLEKIYFGDNEMEV